MWVWGERAVQELVPADKFRNHISFSDLQQEFRGKFWASRGVSRRLRDIAPSNGTRVRF